MTWVNRPACQARLSLSFLYKMNGLVENIRWDPVLLSHRAGRSGVVSPRIHFEFYDYCQGGPALPLLWYIVGHCCRRALDGGNYYSYYFFYYYYYYNYYYDYCYYYYCRDPMSSTRNPTVLFGAQVLQTIVYYTFIGIVFNNFGTVAKTFFPLCRVGLSDWQSCT